MILITGSSGFVGSAVVTALADSGHSVRCLMSRTPTENRYSDQLKVDLVTASINDPIGLRSSLVGVDTVVHLASAQRKGDWEDLMRVDYVSTLQLLAASNDMGVRRFIYLSHLGAERASAFFVLRAKGIIEHFVRASGIPYTVIRGSAIFGPEDSFTNALSAAMQVLPYVFMLPGSGRARVQPLWIGDFAECICQAITGNRFAGETISIGGPEFISVNDLLKSIMKAAGFSRMLVSVPLPMMLFMVSLLGRLFPDSLLATNWLEFISRDCTCEINSVHRYFGLRPARFEDTIGYLSRTSRKQVWK